MWYHYSGKTQVVVCQKVRRLFYFYVIFSGTSSEYRGDSMINVFGDLLACALGYNMARYFNVVLDMSLFPLLFFFLMEAGSAMTIRDNMALITAQLVYPADW